MLHKSASIPVIPNRDEHIINQQKLAALIPLLKNRSYKGNYQVKQDLISILSRFPHFNPIREESSFKYLIEETIDSIEYTFVPKGSFVFHHADVGEKIYFLLDGMADVLVPLPAKDIYKQVKSYELRAFWCKEIDNPDLSIREREAAKLNYHRARCKIIRFQDQHNHPQFFKKLSMFSHSHNNLPSTKPTTLTMNTINPATVTANTTTTAITSAQTLPTTLNEQTPIIDKRILSRYFHKTLPTLGLYKRTNILSSGSFFGEMSVIDQRLRTASIFADEDLHLLHIRGEDYNRIFSDLIPQLHFILKSMQTYFENLTKRQLMQLTYLFDARPLTFTLNQTIFKENQDKTAFYLIRSGSIAFKSGRGIGLGITGQGEFFGFESRAKNSQPQTNITLTNNIPESGTTAITTAVPKTLPTHNDKYLFSANSIENSTTLYRLQLNKLLADQDLLPAVTELSLKGAIKAEYYAKRAEHCQNIFNQTDATFNLSQQQQQFQQNSLLSTVTSQTQPSIINSPGTPRSQTLSNIAYIKKKHIRSLISTFNIERKFINYIKSDQIQQQQQQQSSQQQSQQQHQQNTQAQHQNDSKQTTLTLNIDSPALTDDNNATKHTPRTEEQTTTSPHKKHPPSQSQTYFPIVPEFDFLDLPASSTAAIASTLPVTSNTTTTTSNFLSPPDLLLLQQSQQQQQQQFPQPQLSPSAHVSQPSFQFISQSEFDQTKQMVAKEMEKAKNPPRKAQIYLPQEIADIPLSQHLANRYNNSVTTRVPYMNASTQANAISSLTSIAQNIDDQPLDQQLQSPSSLLNLNPHNTTITSTIVPPNQFINTLSPTLHLTNKQLSQHQHHLQQQQQQQQTTTIPPLPNFTANETIHFLRRDQSDKQPIKSNRMQVPALKITSITRDSIDSQNNNVYPMLSLNKQQTTSTPKITPTTQNNKKPENVQMTKTASIFTFEPTHSQASNLTQLSQSTFLTKSKDSTYSQNMPSMFSPRSTRNNEIRSPLHQDFSKIKSLKFSQSTGDLKVQSHKNYENAAASSLRQHYSIHDQSSTNMRLQLSPKTLTDERMRHSLQIAITDLNSPQNNRPSLLTQSNWMDYACGQVMVRIPKKPFKDSSLSPPAHTQSHEALSLGTITTPIRNQLYKQLFEKSSQTKKLKKNQKIKPLVLIDSPLQQNQGEKGSFKSHTQLTIADELPSSQINIAGNKQQFASFTQSGSFQKRETGQQISKTKSMRRFYQPQ